MNKWMNEWMYIVGIEAAIRRGFQVKGFDSH